MTGRYLFGALAALMGLGAPVAAKTAIEFDSVSGGGSATLPPYLQCVPYARQVTGIALYGDAHTWWEQAEGRYSRGFAPRVGAVMAFKPHGNMRLGHVAAVSRIVDSRTVLLRHANWSPINGRRGQIEDNVRAIDVSPANDWSEVRVWFNPIQGLGSTRWPVQGFIYNQRAGGIPRPVLQNAGKTAAASASAPAVRRAIAAPGLAELNVRPLGQPRAATLTRAQLAAAPAVRVASNDPIGSIIAARRR